MEQKQTNLEIVLSCLSLHNPKASTLCSVYGGSQTKQHVDLRKVCRSTMLNYRNFNPNYTTNHFARSRL